MRVRHHPEPRSCQSHGGNGLGQSACGANVNGSKLGDDSARARTRKTAVGKEQAPALIELSPGTIRHAAERRSRIRGKGSAARNCVTFDGVETRGGIVKAEGIYLHS